MADTPLQTVVRQLRRFAGADGAGGLSDAQLLERFVAARDETAFELLLWRHGAMVLGVCRRVLRHEQDAEDAFQAAFLALARKGRSVVKRSSVGGWLYTVAYRAALAARERSARRSAEVPLPDLPARPAEDADWRDLGRVLDVEVGRLPQRLRVPFVLCCLEGRTLDEAARELGRPRGTVATWLARARARLRARLTGRGVGLGAGLAAAFGSSATAGPPAALVAAALRTSVGGAAAAPGPILSLTERVLHVMFLSQLKAAAAVVLAVVALGAGAGGLMVPAAAADGERPAKSSVQSDGTITVAGDRVSLAGWGEIIDPSQDCTFHQAGDRLKITLPGSDHGLSVEMNRMNAPRVLRAVQGDFIAQVKVSGGLPQGATSVVSGRRPFHGAGLLVWKDEKTYIRLERAGLVFEEKNYAYGNWELRRDGEFVRAGNTGDMPFNDLEPRWLRLERRGDVMYGSIGTDGNQWAALEPIEVKLPGKLLVGVVAGHNTSSGFAPVFEGLRIYQALR